MLILNPQDALRIGTEMKNILQHTWQSSAWRIGHVQTAEAQLIYGFRRQAGQQELVTVQGRK